MALFGLNWEESKGGFTMCSTLLNKILQDLSSKIPPQKKVPWHRRSGALRRGSKGHFCPKNAFFGQKKAFFQKVHSIQKCSVTQNTVFQCVKKKILCSNPKLIFFTKFNLHMEDYYVKTTFKIFCFTWSKPVLPPSTSVYMRWSGAVCRTFLNMKCKCSNDVATKN